MSIIDSLRSYRIFKIAIFDVVVSLLVFFILLVHYNSKHPYLYSLFAIPLGIIVHLLFGVNTQLNYYLGLSEEPNRKE